MEGNLSISLNHKWISSFDVHPIWTLSTEVVVIFWVCLLHHVKTVLVVSNIGQLSVVIFLQFLYLYIKFFSLLFSINNISQSFASVFVSFIVLEKEISFVFIIPLEKSGSLIDQLSLLDHNLFVFLSLKADQIFDKYTIFLKNFISHLHWSLLTLVIVLKSSVDSGWSGNSLVDWFNKRVVNRWHVSQESFV